MLKEINCEVGLNIDKNHDVFELFIPEKDAVFVLAPHSGRIWNKKLKIQPLQREDESSPSCKVMKAEQSLRKRFRTDLKRKLYEHIYFFKNQSDSHIFI